MSSIRQAELRGNTEPRVFTPPLRRLTKQSSMGYIFAEFCEAVGTPLLPYQKWLAIHALELAPGLTVKKLPTWPEHEPIFRFKRVIVLIARQNGKTLFSQMLALFFLFVMKARMIIGTAHTLSLAEEVLDGVHDFIESDDELSELKEHYFRGSGAKKLLLHDGAQYVVKAMTSGTARGLSADLLLLDELREQRDWKAWAAVKNTTQARPRALIWCMSNAGDVESIVLRTLRLKAHAAVGDPDGIAKASDPSKLLDAEMLASEESDQVDDTGLFEWSAPPGIDKHDPSGWKSANPALGYAGLTARTLASGASGDPEWVFRCLDVTTPVLTVHGWKTMDELRSGNWVKGVSGEWTEVIGTSPVREGRDCYRVTLNDGRSIVCDETHLWTVKDRRRPGRYETATTAELIQRGVTYRNPSMGYDVRNYTLPPVTPLDGPDAAVPIDPYLLGLWLGDGSKHAAMIFSEDRDTDHTVSMIERFGGKVTTLKKDSEHCHRIGFRGGRGSRYGGFTEGLRELGVLNNKHIPDLYMVASREQRLWLLRGLMDSDGTVHPKGGKCTFTNANKALIKGVRTLVRSLGWKTSDLSGGKYGEEHHQVRMDVSFTTRPDQPAPVTIPRKLANIKPSKGARDVRPATIVSIEPTQSVPVKCIKVAAEDSLFLAGDLIPTHNTEALCQWPDGSLEGPFPPGAWDAGTWHPDDHPGEALPEAVGPEKVALEMSMNRSVVHAVVAGRTEDGRTLIQHVERRAGTEWVAPWLQEKLDAGLIDEITGQAAGAPASELLERLKAQDFPVTEWRGPQLAAGYGRFYDAVSSNEVIHFPQDHLDIAAATAVNKITEAGAMYVDLKRSPVDASPLWAAVGAYWLLTRPKEEPQQSAYEDRGLLVL